jgi:serine protease Do
VTARSTLRPTTKVALWAVLLASSATAAAQVTPPEPEAAALAGAPGKSVAQGPVTELATKPAGGQAQSEGAERAKNGVVILESSGKPVALGTVLAGDGRIVSALSPLGHGNDVSARFADGSVTKVRVGQSDRGWDLALLVPQGKRWKTGLKASRNDATRVAGGLHAFSVSGKNQLAAAPVDVSGPRKLIGGDDRRLDGALELDGKSSAPELGSPIVDDGGDVVAIVARACAPGQKACKLAPYAAPVSAIKTFLKHGVTRPAITPKGPSLGIVGVADDAGPVKGVRVTRVERGSPAAAAGVRGGVHGDWVVAVDGTPVTTPEALEASVKWRRPGSSVDLLVFRAGKYRQLSLTLGAPAAGKAGPPIGKPPNVRPKLGPRPPDPRRRGF